MWNSLHFYGGFGLMLSEDFTDINLNALPTHITGKCYHPQLKERAATLCIEHPLTSLGMC